MVAAAAGRAGAAEPEQVMGGFAVPYSPEYLKFRSDPRVLQEIARKTGGRVLSASDLDLFHPARQPRESSSPVIDWFLILLAILVPLDVAVRRVQLDWSLIRGWFARRPRDGSTETMSALLQRKQKVKSTLAHPPATHLPSVVQPVATPKQPTPTPETVKPKPPDAAQSTTERLLARKRKRTDGR